MIKRLVVVALAGALLIPLLASAHHVDVSDPDDARGVLDIRRVEMSKGKPPRWKVTTRHRWTVAELWDRGFILVYLDTFGTSRSDYYALVRSNGLRLIASLYRERSGKSDLRIGSLRARHPSRKLANVAIPLSDLRRRGSKLYRWYALTMLSGDRCKRFCFDRAPDNGLVTEPGPRPTVPPPTPTLPPVTPTPTTTP